MKHAVFAFYIGFIINTIFAVLAFDQGKDIICILSMFTAILFGALSISSTIILIKDKIWNIKN